MLQLINPIKPVNPLYGYMCAKIIAHFQTKDMVEPASRQ